MKKTTRFRKKVNNFLFDHIQLKNGLDNTLGAILAIFAAALYAFGFYCFVSPVHPNTATLEGSAITTGGIGGISQVLYLILTLCNIHIDQFTMQSVCYFALNVPLIIFAFFKIGKRFSLLTLLNVVFSSVFIQVFDSTQLFKDVAALIENDHLTRTVLSGVFVGLASAIAFKANISCGGIDIISYYFALRKSTSVGKYTMTLNGIIVTSFACLTIAINNGQKVELALMNLIFSILYIFVNVLVIDFINTRNKKAQIQIITVNKSVSAVLIANFPHGTTIINGEGGYSHKDRIVIYMTVSSNEVKKVVDTVKKVDEHAFITVSPIIQAYGNFFIKPIE